jgi:nucleotide-binding universal stress UspA family protein
MFRHVIVGVDGGPTGRDAVAVAKLLVAPDTRLALAHVYELTPFRGASGAYGVAEHDESMRLLEQEREAIAVGVELITVTASSVGRGLHYLAETQAADLLTVGSSARSLAGRVLVGDVTRASLIGAPCAVAVAPLGYAQAVRAIAKIGVGYDGSPESEAALAIARELAALHGATVTALTVVEPSPYAGLIRAVARGYTPEKALAEAKDDLAALDGVDGELASGLAGEELAAFGAHVDLLIVGSRGYGPIRRLMLGSTSAHLASNARCPLLVLPRLADDEVDPQVGKDDEHPAVSPSS